MDGLDGQVGEVGLDRGLGVQHVRVARIHGLVGARHRFDLGGGGLQGTGGGEERAEREEKKTGVHGILLIAIISQIFLII